MRGSGSDRVRPDPFPASRPTPSVCTIVYALNAALASVIGVVDSADARPTVPARALAEEYMARIDAELDRLKAVLDRDLAAFSDLVSEAGLPPVDTP